MYEENQQALSKNFMWLSAFQIVVVLASAGYTVWNLKTFFVKKAIYWLIFLIRVIFVVKMEKAQQSLKQLYIDVTAQQATLRDVIVAYRKLVSKGCPES